MDNDTVLRGIFSNIQFIVSTYAPSVINSVRSENDPNVKLNLNCRVDEVRLPDSRKQALAAVEESIGNQCFPKKNLKTYVALMQLSYE